MQLPDSLIEHCQRTQALRDGIKALPERCQAMVRMLFFETPARPYRDVAQALGVATGSIGFMRMTMPGSTSVGARKGRAVSVAVATRVKPARAAGSRAPSRA